MKRVTILLAAAVLVAAFGAAACGSDSKTSTKTPSSSMRDAGSISVTGAWARTSQMTAGGMMTPGSGGMMTPGSGMMTPGSGASDRGAAYMVIKNSGSATDALIGASSDVADKTEIHETRMVDGNATMAPVARIDVPAGGSVELKPVSFHVRFFGLKQPLTVGAKITINLQFEKGGTIPVEAAVREQ
jgi:copper(I)-binding protein